MTATAFEILSWLWILLGVASCIIVAIDIRRRKPQPMAVMNFVWPINALWAGPIGIRAYWATGRTGPLAPQPLPAQAKQGMDMAPRPFWQSIIAGTLHCGADAHSPTLSDPSYFGPRRSSSPAA